jgi:hypothetical protein
MKSVKPKDWPRDCSGEPTSARGARNAEAYFHGDRGSNKTHASTPDPEAILYKKGKGKEAKLCFMWHGQMENCHGLLVGACLTQADDQKFVSVSEAIVESGLDLGFCSCNLT